MLLGRSLSKDVNPHRAHRSEVGHARGALSGVPLPYTGSCRSPPNPAQPTQGSLLVSKFCFRWAWGQKQQLASSQRRKDECSADSWDKTLPAYRGH